MTIPIPEAAKRLGLTTRGVYELVETRELPYVRGDGTEGRGTLVRIPLAAIDAYLAR